MENTSNFRISRNGKYQLGLIPLDGGIEIPDRISMEHDVKRMLPDMSRDKIDEVVNYIRQFIEEE